MLTGKNTFYNRSIRHQMAAFSSLFTNVWVTRRDDRGAVLQQIQVPMNQADKSSWFLKRKQDKLEGNLPISQLTMPRIYIDLIDMVYDSTRQTVSTALVQKKYGNDNKAYTQFQRVPYDFTFEVGIGQENLDDAFQILEQILPYFSPSFTIEINDLVDMKITTDIPVILKSGPTRNQEVVKNFEGVRKVGYTLTFMTKGYIYPPVQSQGIIRRAFVKVSHELFPDTPMEQQVSTAAGVHPEDGITTVIETNPQNFTKPGEIPVPPPVVKS